MERRTTKPEYYEPLLETLRKIGASTENELLNKTYHEMNGKLHPSDYVVLPNGEPRWRNQMQNMLDGLIESGKVSKKNGRLSLSEHSQP